MDVFNFVYFLVLHGVNTAMYFAVTRVAYGWTKTILGLIAYFGFVAVHIMHAPHVGANPADFAPYCFPVGFGSWLVATVAMSRRGSRPAAFFVAVLCGAHQLVASVICYALMNCNRSEGLSKLIASVLMLGMGVCMIRLVLPRVRRLSQSVDWRLLDVVVCILLALVYATGFWPIWAAGGSWREAIPFAISVLMIVSFFPMVFLLSEKSRAAARLTQAESNVRLMAEEMRTRRTAIDEARRVRHDRRHHCVALAGFLRARQYDKALTYVEELEADLDASAKALVWCENETVNAILSGFSRKALAARVKLEAEASVPRQLAIPDVELVAVFANLIENAINAAEKVGGMRAKVKGQAADGNIPLSDLRPQTSDLVPTPQASVAVRLVCVDSDLCFRVSNAVPDGFALHDGWPCATPGVGLQSVRSVIKRHGGVIDYALEGGRLTARGILSCR